MMRIKFRGVGQGGEASVAEQIEVMLMIDLQRLVHLIGNTDQYRTLLPHGTIRTVHMTYATSLKTATHPKTRCRKPYAATQHLMLLMMGVCTRNMSS
jgi:hypothetical protein